MDLLHKSTGFTSNMYISWWLIGFVHQTGSAPSWSSRHVHGLVNRVGKFRGAWGRRWLCQCWPPSELLCLWRFFVRITGCWLNHPSDKYKWINHPKNCQAINQISIRLFDSSVWFHYIILLIIGGHSSDQLLHQPWYIYCPLVTDGHGPPWLPWWLA